MRLWGRMSDLGMGPHDGWRIHDETCETGGGLALRLRPVHRTRVAPEGLTVVLLVGESDS